MNNYNELKTKLDKYGQLHMLKFWNDLDDNEKDRLSNAIEEINFERINELIPLINENNDNNADKNLTQAPYIKFPAEDENGKFYMDIHRIGETELRAGKVCAFVVAGGQGTRLGYDAPKGLFPIGPVSEKSLFNFHFDQLTALEKYYNIEIPFLIMTSEMTHDDTVSYIEKNNYFGYNKDNVFIFQQGKMPGLSMDGKILMKEKSYPAFAPNGHGGSIFALRDSGVMDKLIEKGIEHIFYFQIDNVLARICEPYFIGCHAKDNNDITLKVIEKKYPEEKLGVYVYNNDKPFIIEYSDMSDEELHEKENNGELKYRMGSHAVHVLSVDFLKNFTDKYANLPYHKAVKKIPYVNNNGVLVKPDKPNGVKFEMFIFDILPYSTKDKVLAVEGIREREFAPLKNKTGIDSIETAKSLYMEDSARILSEAGMKDIPRNEDGTLKYKIELTPYYKIFRSELADKISDIKIDRDIII